VQQENQRQIVGKLLHDVRNPVHSIRISMELFGRLARRTGDVDKLMERAAAYVDPAEAAVKNLVTNCERLARYVVVAAPTDLQPFPVEEMVAEVIMLLRAARRRLQVTSTLPGDAVLNVKADRIRVCHLLLHTCLNNPAVAVAITVRAGANGLVVFDVAFQAGAGDEPARANPLRAEEIQAIVESAGGALLAATPAALSMEFRRADAPPHG
jgi:nitrogen fixation/metabolism regulation signal transduction histidine kinase